jgi:putative DNA methylase
VAIVGRAASTGKVFQPATPHDVPSAAILDSLEAELLAALGATLPASVIPVWSGIANPALYGIRSHSDFLNRRQRVVLLCLIKLLRDEFERLRSSEGELTAKAVIGMLSGLIDQLVDWNSRLSMWIPQNEQVGRGFCGPGVAMLWDYAETDPVSGGPSNLWDKLKRIVAGARLVSRLSTTCSVDHGYAQRLPYPDEYFDAIVTDPPYYDNIYYSVLADFFFAWKRLLLVQLDPDLFRRAHTDASKELVASSFRSGDPEKAHEDYCKEFSAALREAERVLKKSGVFALLYSHSSLKGWEALVRGYRPRGLVITSVQPLSIERKQRPRAMSSEAVNTCVVFVSHKTQRPKPRGCVREICDQVRVATERFAVELSQAGWSAGDIGMASFAQGVGLLANYSAVDGCADDLEALRLLERAVQERVPAFKVRSRTSL